METCITGSQRGRVASLIQCGPASVVAPGLTMTRAEDLLDWLEANGFPPAHFALDGSVCTVTTAPRAAASPAVPAGSLVGPGERGRMRF